MGAMMETFLVCVGITLFVMMLPVLYRIVIGPTAIDRIVAVNIIGTKTAVLLLIIGTLFGNVGMFVDFALAYALLNFIGSLAAARYIARACPVDGRNADRLGVGGGEGAT